MLKEQLVPNKVEAPTLFVGVGGTGSKIVKAVAEMCLPEEKESINFVCLDTNVNDLTAVKNSKSNIYYVQTSSTQTVGDYLNYDKDALKNWFPKSAVIYDKTVSEGAGQVRAISRLALNSCIKTGKIQPLYDAIDDLFRKDGKELKQAMRIVIASTASGGTGSGIILPLSMFIRDYINNKYPSTAVLVRAMIMLPETLDSVIKSNTERESQRRNAYATIKEINAFMMKGSGFLDVDEDLKRYSNIHVDITEQGTNQLKPLALLPFDFCFLMDGQNAEDSTLTSIGQYIKQAALALYEQNVGPMMKNAFSVEDNIIKELSNPGNYGRNRFGGIGAGAIRYPYEDIVRYVAYDWAKDAIGGEGEAAKWTRYDKKYELKKAEETKRGIPSSEQSKIREVYVSEIDTGKDSFSVNLNNLYTQEADEAIDAYISALEDEMCKCMEENAAIRTAMSGAQKLSKPLTYEKDDGTRGNATQNMGKLRAFENAVKNNIDRPAKSKAEAIFQNESKTENAPNEGREYTLEYLFNSKINGVLHPNAMRYFLYVLEGKFEDKIDEVNALVAKNEKTLRDYSQNADREELFDADYSKDKKEKCIDELCAAEKDAPSIGESLGGYQKIYDKLNDHFPKWFKAVYEYGRAKAKAAAYEYGLQFIKDLNKEFENFYRTFPKKVSALDNRQRDLVEALRFNEGDSVMNVCASKEMLEELSLSTKALSAKGAMLDSELCGKVYDAIKSNVIFNREVLNSDVVEEDRTVDIFDEILLEYFENSVCTTCKDIDINIVEAIAKERRLMGRIEARKELKKGEKLVDKVSADECRRHIMKVIDIGKRLSAPSIQRPRNEEPREIELVAYNKSLKDMRTYKMDDLLPNGSAVETVSKYELHYFNALYNLTPNKLDKFAAKVKTETRKKNAGLYHDAYQKYARQIGPDSTKNASISTHIDKRWDSIAVMPELDFNFQNLRMTQIHQAMIYGLVYGAISYRNLSLATGGKQVYKYEDSDERFEELIVSNGTLCDEFYEILDAMYINSAIVGDMDIIRAKKSKNDAYRNSNYASTTFAKCVEEFHIDNFHDGKASLLEIPLAYYQSLPNSQRFGGEIATLIESVIKTFRDEINRWEDPDDAKFILCNVLCDQFKLMAANFKAYEAVSGGLSISEHIVIDQIYRKVKNVLEEVPEPDDYEDKIAEIKAFLQD